MLLEWRDAALAPVPSKRPLAAAAVARALDPRRPMSQQLRSGLEPEPLTSVKPAQVVYCADMLLGWTLPPPFDPWMGE
jgi:hypothetical protein